MKHQNLLFSTLYGSRLYGTQTPTSDLDLKHIVLPDLETLLLGRKVENKCKHTNNEANVRNSVDDVDEEFIPLQIFARHFVEGQTYAIELAFAIDGAHANQTIFDNRGKVGLYSTGHGKNTKTSLKTAIYCRNFEDYDYETPLIVEFVHELRTKFLTSNIKAMMGYVVNQASLYSFKGERLNATRELQDILHQITTTETLKFQAGEEHDDVDELRISEIEATYKDMFVKLAAKYPKYFRKDLYDVGGGVMRPCFVILEKTLPFTNTILQTRKVLHALVSKYGSRADQASESNVDWKATMHAMRIVDEGLELLENHTLTFPFKQDYVDHLLSMKRGELPLDPIKDELSAKLDRLKDLEKTTTLPAADEEFMKTFDVWLTKWLRKFYNL